MIKTGNGQFYLQIPAQAELPVDGGKILQMMCSEGNRVSLDGGKLTVELKAPFEAVAVHITR